MYKNCFFIPQADTTPSIIHGMAIVAVQTVMSHTCKLIIATWLSSMGKLSADLRYY